MRGGIAVWTAGALLALAPVGAEAACPPVELFYDDAEQLAEKRTDTNRDCKPNEVVHYENGRPVRAELDRSGDGAFDTWLVYEADGKTLAREELDTDADGQRDRSRKFGRASGIGVVNGDDVS